jgi:tRNA pseudouridine38-40 synthase
MAMRNLRVVVEYDGADFLGFQRHPGRRTVQGELERALSKITKEHIAVVGAGRTDSGVHALGQVISFKTNGTIPTDKVAVAMNDSLPRDVVARDVAEVPEEFHARYSARSRRYRYTILNSALPSALRGRYRWFVPHTMDLEEMQRGAEYLLGGHDFVSFCVSGMETLSTVREIKKISVCRKAELILFDIEANAFLRSMARIIVGTLVEVGQGRRKCEDIREILDSKDRRLAGRTAPPQGLVLVEVTY